MERYTLKNGIKILIKTGKNTPRTALVMYAELNKDEKKAGLYYLFSQMLFQGTKNRTSAQLVNELDENAVELCIEKKSDYIRFKLLFLNEDINLALEILQDILENSTFDNFQKEIIKIKGEFESDLDSPKILAQDNYYRTIFKNHPYGTGRKEMIEQLGFITKDELLSVYYDIKYEAQKNICVIGDINENSAANLLENYFKNLSVKDNTDERAKTEPLSENMLSVEVKEDANQAQIFKGWLFPTVYSPDYAQIILLNTILGSSGLSSRLFLELREKQGLAYTVRSVYEPYMLAGSFYVYIATEPKNIKTSLEGFENEINKIMTELISDEELENAKNNAVGKRQFYTETNMSEASLYGYYEFLNLGFEFEEKLIGQIKSASKEQIIKTASEYFSKNSVLCVLAPEQYLIESGLLK